MPTNITRVVEEIISADPFLSYTLNSGLINYSALAAKIRPAVEKLYGGSVKENTIVQSLRRLGRNMTLTDYTLVAKSIASADYHIIQGIRERVFPVSELAETFSGIPSGGLRADSTLIVFVADGLVTLLADEGVFSLIGERKDEEEFTLLKIVLKQEYAGLPGLSAYLSQVLGNNRIIPRNIIRRGNQIFVVFSKKDSEALFRAIQGLQKPTVLLNETQG
ncbi:MAG: hypothetical protein QW514_06115 [Thermoprotei archaeon]